MDLNGMSDRLGSFYAKRLGNCVHVSLYLHFFVWSFKLLLTVNIT